MVNVIPGHHFSYNNSELLLQADFHLTCSGFDLSIYVFIKNFDGILVTRKHLLKDPLKKLFRRSLLIDKRVTG